MLSEKIRALRKRTGLSQEEFAEKLDVSRQAVSKWELGSAVPTADKLVDIADFFGVSLDYLMRNGALPNETAPVPPQSSGESKKRKRLAAILLLSFAAFLGIIVLILYVTGAGVLGGGSGITINGTGMLAALAVTLGAVGAFFLFLSIK